MFPYQVTNTHSHKEYLQLFDLVFCVKVFVVCESVVSRVVVLGVIITKVG